MTGAGLDPATSSVLTRRDNQLRLLHLEGLVSNPHSIPLCRAERGRNEETGKGATGRPATAQASPPSLGSDDDQQRLSIQPRRPAPTRPGAAAAIVPEIQCNTPVNRCQVKSQPSLRQPRGNVASSTRGYRLRDGDKGEYLRKKEENQ